MRFGRTVPESDAGGYDRVGRSATKLLSQIGEPAVDPLIGVLKTGTVRRRYLALRALTRIQHVRTVTPIIDALSIGDREFRHLAAFALVTMTGYDFGLDQTQWREWWEQNRSRLATPAALNGSP